MTGFGHEDRNSSRIQVGSKISPILPRSLTLVQRQGIRSCLSSAQSVALPVRGLVLIAGSTDMKKLLLLSALAVIAQISAAIAQAYPTRPITIIVPYPAGGPTDALARLLAEPMKALLG